MGFISDTSLVFNAIKSICPFKGNQIIIESTCPVGTTEKVSSYIKKCKD